jgi:hypothetical protein
MEKTTKERVREALEKMPDDLPLYDFLDRLHGLVQIEASREDVENGRVVSNDEFWKTRSWRR